MNTPINANPKGIPERSTPGTEASDVSVRGVMIFAGILLLSGVIIHIGLAWMERHLAERESRGGQQQIQNQARQSRPNFPEPRLQISPGSDMRALREREEAELNSYGWVNRTEGLVRIPIRHAMELLVQQGLPVRDPNDKGKSNLDLMRERAQTK
jgi:hypothetical protein